MLSRIGLDRRAGFGSTASFAVGLILIGHPYVAAALCVGFIIGRLTEDKK